MSEILTGSIDNVTSGIASAMLGFLVAEGIVLLSQGHRDVDQFSFSMLTVANTMAIFFSMRSYACALFAVLMFIVTMLNVLI